MAAPAEMDADLLLPPAQIANRVLIFRKGPMPSSVSVPRGHSVDFSARPCSEWDLTLNRFIHSSVLHGFVDPKIAKKLFGLHAVALILPPPLAQWLVRWNRPQVERAIACILIDASGIEGSSDAHMDWTDEDHTPMQPQSPNNVFPNDADMVPQEGQDIGSVSDIAKRADEFAQSDTDDDDDLMAYDSDDIPPCPAVLDRHDMQSRRFVPETPPLSTLIHGVPAEHRNHPCPALPYVTEASKQLDDLLQLLAGDTLWTIPVQFVALHPRRVLGSNSPPGACVDEQTSKGLSIRSLVSCLNTDLELDAQLTFNIPKPLREKSGLFAQEPVLTSQSVHCLFEKWLLYYSYVSRIGVHPRRALHDFGRLVASGKENALWDSVNTVMEIAGMGSESMSRDSENVDNSTAAEPPVLQATTRSGWCLHSTCRCSSHVTGSIGKASTYAIMCNRSRRNSHRLLHMLPADLIKDVLIPTMVTALSD